MKTILVPVDFSDNSKNALNYAIGFAKKMNYKIVLVHAFQPTLVEAISDSIKILKHQEISGTPKDIKDQLKLWQKEVLDIDKNLECNAIFIEGNLADEINEITEDNDIDLIIMGTKGATGLKSVFMGSNTARVIETVLLPVLAIPSDYIFQDYKTIAFATDYHDNDKITLEFLVELSKQFNSNLEVIHIAKNDIKARYEEDLLEHFVTQIKKAIDYKKMNFHLMEGEDNINKALTEFIIKNKVDLIAISTVDRILHGPLFNRGITKDLTHHIQVPLLVFHAYDDGDIDLF